MRNHLPAISAVLLVAGLAGAALAAGKATNVSATRHNLSSTGPGPIKVAGTANVCEFCHTPHASNPIAPLWNRSDPGTYYETYESSTLRATVGQPTGSSRLCLSCHDGTIALTQTFNPRSALPGTIYISPEDRGYIGTDLTDDHPISFTFNEALVAKDPHLRSPSSLPPELPLDPNRQLQCTTCHDPHDGTYGNFLRMDNRDSRMCTSCHNVDGWASSSHAASAASLAPATRDRWDNVPYTTVRQNGCENCHRPHSAQGRQRLLRHQAEEDNCFSCHDGTVASKNVMAEFSRISTHPVRARTGVHDPQEDPLTMQEHVECADCHDAHQAAAGPAAQAPLVKPSIKGATGITRSRREPEPAAFEYEVCYKCHSFRNPTRAVVVQRVLGDNNIAEEFSPVNLGYHPVEAQGKNVSVPSLFQPYLATTIIYCTDCHGSDAGAGGPQGPHGSQYTPMLKANYVTLDRTPESPEAYALCYGCHNRDSIIHDQSFPKHHKHIQDKKTPCSVCHDAHGVRENAHLINFDRDVVLPSPGAPAAGKDPGPSYQSTGLRRGSCTLLCHDKDHVDKHYAP